MNNVTQSFAINCETEEEKVKRNLEIQKDRKFLMIYLPIQWIIHAIMFLLLCNYIKKLMNNPAEKLREVSYSDWFYILFYAKEDNFEKSSSGNKKYIFYDFN
jgi:hypothetical protein